MAEQKIGRTELRKVLNGMESTLDLMEDHAKQLTESEKQALFDIKYKLNELGDRLEKAFGEACKDEAQAQEPYEEYLLQLISPDDTTYEELGMTTLKEAQGQAQKHVKRLRRKSDDQYCVDVNIFEHVDNFRE